MEFYGLKTCDTCRKALKALHAGGHDVTVIDVRTDGVPREVLDAALKDFSDKLINTRSTTWRGLDEAARNSDPVDLLQAHPTLMKRPLIVDGARMTLGWSAAVAAEYQAV